MTAINEDKLYSDNYDRPTKSFAKAHDHINSSKYKVNHDGYEPAGHKPHKKPDITMHYAMGDDQPHAYTVHKDGAAASDKKLHHPRLQREEYTSQDFYADYISRSMRK